MCNEPSRWIVDPGQNVVCHRVASWVPVGQHGGRSAAGGDVPWWVWVLVVWSALALALGLALGAVIRAVDRRGTGCERPIGDEEPGEHPWAS